MNKGPSPACKLLIRSARTDSTPDQIVPLARNLKSAEWSEFKLQFLHHNTGPLIARTINKNGLEKVFPRHVWKLLKREEVRQKIRNQYLIRDLSRLVSAAQSNGLNPILFKGFSLAYYYEDIGLRHMNDIDLLLPYEEILQMVKVAQSLGYVFAVGSERGLSIDNVSIEEVKESMDPLNRRIHIQPMFNPDSPTRPSLDIHYHVIEPSIRENFDIEGAIKRARVNDIWGVEVRTLEPADALWAYALNIYRDVSSIVVIILGRDLRFSRYCDVHELFARSPVDTWKKLATRVETSDAKLACTHALYTTEHFFPGSIPTELLDRWKSRRWKAQHQITLGPTFANGVDGANPPIGFWARDASDRIFDSARLFEVLPIWWALNEADRNLDFHACKVAKRKVDAVLRILYGNSYNQAFSRA